MIPNNLNLLRTQIITIGDFKVSSQPICKRFRRHGYKESMETILGEDEGTPCGSTGGVLIFSY